MAVLENAQDALIDQSDLLSADDLELTRSIAASSLSVPSVYGLAKRKKPAKWRAFLETEKTKGRICGLKYRVGAASAMSDFPIHRVIQQA